MTDFAINRTLVIASLFPSILNTNGDAANARVLAQRARWAGLDDVRLVEVEEADQLPNDASVVVVGACGDPDVGRAFDALFSVKQALHDAAAASVPLLAVATGWNILSQKFPVDERSLAPGLGLFSGSARRSTQRFSDDLIADSVHGQLVGYENHSDSYIMGQDEQPLGHVVYGSGNSDGTEGVINGSLIGTHLHGPVLARNPALADYLLTLALARIGKVLPESSEHTLAADQFAANARAAVKASLS